MTNQSCYVAVAALGLCPEGALPSHASTNVPTPGYAHGIGYEFGVMMSGNDHAVYQVSLGALSWTHASDWTAIELT